MSDRGSHKPVFLREAIDLLQVKKNEKYIDATLGSGGHTKKILELGGKVLGIDADYEAISYVKNSVSSPNLTVLQGNFKDIDKISISKGFNKVSGIIYDLGVSSNQLSSKTRGFSFQSDGPLDMRMDSKSKVTAADILNLASKDELYEIFTKFGEERNSSAISNSIVRTRRVKAFRTTSDLVRAIESVYKIKGEVSDRLRANLNKRVFQALRVAVNSELENLEVSLPKALELLQDNGRLIVIGFHSLEDRIIKENFLDFEKRGLGKVITKKPLVPTEQEVMQNPRARSAKLRAFKRTD